MLNKKGFTLAELLIVVAIIAVLVAIAIPIFTNQLEKSRESTDLANARSAYAAVMTAAAADDTTSSLYQGDGTYQMTISPLKQTKDGWTTKIDSIDIGGVPSNEWVGTPKAAGSCTVSYYEDSEEVVISWSSNESEGGSGGGSGEGGGSGNNNETANNIGREVINMLKNASSGNSTKVTITVNPDGTYSISVSGKKANISASQLEEGLKSAGLISSSGSIPFDSSDTTYSNGYKITVNKNNGKDGGTIHISKN